MAPRDGPDDDFIDNVDEKVLLGHDAQNNRLLAYGSLAPQSLEDYLLKFRANWWQKFLAKYLGISSCLGYFQKAGHKGHMNWFVLWCSNCQRFAVSYEHGFDRRLDCEVCLSKSYP